jgi:hypothetical protein
MHVRTIVCSVVIMRILTIFPKWGFRQYKRIKDG